MKICWLIPDDYWGGVFPVSYEVCRQGRLAGHDIRMLMVCKPASGHKHGLDVPVESLGLAPNAASAPVAILNWVTKGGFDALVLNGCGEADGIPPYLPDSIRCVYVIHNTPRMYWISAVRHERSIDLVVAISEFVATVVKPHMRFPQRLVTIYNGSTYPAAPVDTDERTGDLLFLGGDEPRKGAEDLLRIWTKLVNLQFNGRLHWCGHLAESFKNQISALPAGRQIVVHGRVPREQVFQLAAECKVLLMLSRAEAFGMVTIEAMSMGCVPVAWDVDTGTKEIAQPKVHGFFAPLGNYYLLASAVMEAAAQHSALARGIMVRARESFSVARMWTDYEQNFAEVLKSPRLQRSLAGQPPPSYVAPMRPSHLMPAPVRMFLKDVLQSNPRVAQLLNHFWGM